MNAHVTALIKSILTAVGGFTADLTNILAGVTSIDTKLDVNLSTRATETTAATLGTEVTLAAMSAKIVEPGTWTPATAIAPADNGLLKATPGTLNTILAANSHATDVFYLQLFDANALPINGTAPRLPSIPIAAGQTVSIDLGRMAFATGIYWASSSTVATLTVTASTPMQVSGELT